MEISKGISLLNEIEVKGLISDFYYELPRDFDYSGESHSGWEFVYVECGKVSVRADDATYIIKKGELVCHKPFEFHTIKPYEKNSAVIIFCFETDNEYMGYFNNKILSVNQRQKQYLNDIANMGRSVFIYKDPLDIANDGQMEISPSASELEQQFIKNSIELLIISLLDTSSTEKESRIILYEHFSQRKSLTQNIIKYLEQNIGENINLSDISHQFSYSLSSIKRIFKEETGSGIISYLNNMRMDLAMQLLKNKDLSINEIARKVGFENTYYFSNAFKKRWGKSPSKFRTNK